MIFAIVPVVANIAVSFTQWSGIKGAPVWVGLDNYLRYLRPPYDLIVLNTAFFAVAILVISTVLAFFVAVLLDQKIRGVGLYRSLWYLPTVTAASVMAQLTVVFIAPFGGVLNNIIVALGGSPVIWTIDPFWMPVIIVVYSVWRTLGKAMVLFLAGLQSIDPHLYDAAAVDGAGRWARIRYVTLPLLKPITLFIVVTGIIDGFQIFEAVQLISKGGPFGQTNVMLLQIYQDAYVNHEFGLASAGASIMTLILLGASLTMFRMMRSEER